jgi:hypothetical protein
VCLMCVIVKPRKMRRPRPPRGCRAIGKKGKKNFNLATITSLYVIRAHLPDINIKCTYIRTYRYRQAVVFPIIFRRFRIVAKSTCYRHVLRLSVHLPSCRLSARPPLDRFSSNLILGTFIKICREYPTVVKIGQKYRAL